MRYLRTFEVIQFEKYWRFIFNQFGYGTDEIGLKARLEYFKRISSFESPWVICDNCIAKYFAKNTQNKLLMKEWAANKGDYQPPKNGDFRKHLNEENIKRISFIIVTVE